MSHDDLVISDADSTTGVANLVMNNPPVNSLSLEMIEALSKSIKQVEDDPSMKAMILQSTNPKIFSAGLDIMEMYNPDSKRLCSFWSAFQDLYLDLYGSRLACVATMLGTAPAAGCFLALSCDYRIMLDSPSAKIGLNEVHLGIVAPPWLARQMIDTVGARQAELSLGLGTLYSPVEALQVGLVDEIVNDKETILSRAKEVARDFTKIPAPAFTANKLGLRGDAIARMRETRTQDLEHFVSFVTRDETQANLGAYHDALKRK
eukprot:CAMPEP_0168731266 /NCGR_PEP_ID=MMETSP0724-20121128/7162_1 /TAXON_ID=265536 /ORGANISM="Amphiprora sp., Strain CCMP467" /LENGTH=261 /DNA_ID=CAMNT_0008778239 /DNA_START=139 /DNA_END=924 /DNA_ORIENTATION=-